MKDIYNHLVYYAFSLMLFCAPPRALAQEGSLEKAKPAQEQRHPVLPPKEETSPAASPPPQDGRSTPNTFAIPETTVTGAQENSYKAASATTATKTETPLRDIPQSISVVTERVVKSQNAFTLRDALKNVSGLTIAAGEGGRTGDSITLRGFAANSDIYLDGVKDNGQYFRDTFFLERIEALKGPSSVLFGRGTTGGLINIITKKPNPELMAQGEFTYGSFDFKRGTLDVGGAVTGFMNARLSALYQEADSFREFNFTDRWGLAPSLGFSLGNQTSLTLQLLHQEEDSAFDYGLPMFRGKPARVDENTFYGYPDDRLQKYDTTIATAVLTHKFSSDLSVRNSFRYGDYERRYRSHLFGAVTDRGEDSTIARSQALRLNTQQNLYNQTDFTWNSPLFGREHTLLFGAEFGRENFDFRSKNSTGITPISIFHPVLTRSVGTGRANDFDGTLNTYNDVQAETQSFYSQSQFTIAPQWKTLAGFRWDRFHIDFHNRLPGAADFQQTDTMFSYRFGLVWEPEEMQSYYFSYGTGFNPSAETFALSAATVDLDPEENRNFEVGAKIDLFDGRLSATGALFRLEKTNARTPDPNDPTRNILAGEQRTEGFELGLAGIILPRWNVSASYAYLDGTTVKANAAAGAIPSEGKGLPNVPRNSGVVWASYELTDAFEVGGGVFFAGHRFTSNTHVAKLPGYTRLDGMLAYHHKNFDLQLNLFNLADELYFESGQTSSALPGIPLSAQVTLRVKY
ncbi:MAG: TonB-dependent siderophore receptor [Deltaproteobacteria bacterium]|nr:TonB-dependent siderophore receptor [Deltaproteobacteria bacterium]